MKRTEPSRRVKRRPPAALAAEIGTPSTPREAPVLDLFFLFIEACESLTADAAGVPVTAEELDEMHLAVAIAHVIGASLADARDFLRCDNWHRQAADMNRSELRRLWHGHRELQALIARANARDRARVQVST